VEWLALDTTDVPKL
jgi:hypothetical protein